MSLLRIFTKKYWQERIYNGALISNGWQQNIQNKTADLVLGSEPKKKGKNTVRKGKR